MMHTNSKLWFTIGILLYVTGCGERILPLDSELDLFAVCAEGFGTTYYVRVDGGGPGECNGLNDTPYDSETEDEDCALAHPAFALSPLYGPLLQAGDRLVIMDGEYAVGCSGFDEQWYEDYFLGLCDPLTVPEGIDDDHPTCILGEGWDDNCDNPPELVSRGFPESIIELAYTSEVAIACLEIRTDQECIFDHPVQWCDDDYYDGWDDEEHDYPEGPMGESDGIRGFQAAGVALRDIYVHGHPRYGLNAAAISDWTIDSSVFSANGHGGIRIVPTTPNEEETGSWGEFYLREVIVALNGCIEEDGFMSHCWDGSSEYESYEDLGNGIHIENSSADWFFEKCQVYNNTGTGILIDLVNDEPSIVISQTLFEGNAGYQLAVSGNTTIVNTLLAANCAYFEDNTENSQVLPCQNGGAAIAMSPNEEADLVLVNSTIWGVGETIFSETDQEAHFEDFDNISVFALNCIFAGDRQDDLDPDLPFLTNIDYELGEIIMDYNGFFNLEGEVLEELCEDPESICEDPLFQKVDLDQQDELSFLLSEGSPYIDQGIVDEEEELIPDVDLMDNPRPEGEGIDMGAYEFIPD